MTLAAPTADSAMAGAREAWRTAGRLCECASCGQFQKLPSLLPGEAARCIRTLGGGKPRIEKYTVPGTDAVHSVVIIPKTAPTPAKYPRRFAMIKKQPL